MSIYERMNEIESLPRPTVKQIVEYFRLDVIRQERENPDLNLKRMRMKHKRLKA